jgi:signal transduction histidine kinase/CheY-like chemotaxis protein
VHDDHPLTSWFEQAIARLPVAFREGKKPYVFFFVSLMVTTLLLYVAISPYQNASLMLLLMAVFLTGLLVLINYGMPLAWGVHMGTAAGLVLLCFAVWPTGGVFSPRVAWLMILPLTPFYVIGRRAGIFWLCLVWAVQLSLALNSYAGLLPPFELGLAQSTSSWITFSLVTGVLIIIPMIYDRLHVKAVAQSMQYQRELEIKRKELEHTLKMRENFIATVSHELRTPMNAILGFNDLLLDRVQDKPEALKVLNHTRQSADHLMTVINDILDYSQLQAGQLVVQSETFELRKITGYAFDLFRPKVKSMVLDYRIEIDENLPTWVHTDRHRLMQILVNLLGNALKFTHQGSVVFRVQWENPGVLFLVTDTGIGIAPERHAQIFKRFGQADMGIQPRYGGNGLGLAISQKLAHLLGGDIGFESALGQGSRFWLRLPLRAAQAPEPIPPMRSPAVQTGDQAWRFLVVDDHPVNRLLVKKVLQNGWPQSTILEASEGQQALQCLREQTVDLVLMDMVMPVMDGIAATRALRQDFAAPVNALPVLGLTANVNAIDLEAFRQAGLSDLMLKPFEPAQLCAKVEQWLLTSKKSSPGS